MYEGKRYLTVLHCFIKVIADSFDERKDEKFLEDCDKFKKVLQDAGFMYETGVLTSYGTNQLSADLIPCLITIAEKIGIPKDRIGQSLKQK